jgi:hypothetical protein
MSSKFPHSPSIDRRQFLDWSGRGIGATAALSRLHGKTNPEFAPRARRVVQISLPGGLSHLDSFDPKPELEKFHGKPFSSEEKPDIFFGKVGLIRKADWAFKKRGQSGLEISELFPHIASIADELTVIRSLVTNSANHTPACFFVNTGFEFNGYPSLGSWVSYGLGNESNDLPTYVVLPDKAGRPSGGAANWSNAFLPALHQGAEFRNGDKPVRDLHPPDGISPDADAGVREFLRKVNAKHRDRVGDDALLIDRIRSYELAARMQLAIPEVSRLEDEPASVTDAYGLNEKPTEEFARRCILARRLLERGVRFVQLYAGSLIHWDAHDEIVKNHGNNAKAIDKPVAALVRDLKQRGMLDDTLVLFTTEFGRTPFSQADAGKVGSGRDHNRYGFSAWMAGAGLKPGTAYGRTDEIGWKVVENPVTWHDFHATVLHLLGLNHEGLTFYHNGIQRRLTNVHGNVLHEIIA